MKQTLKWILSIFLTLFILLIGGMTFVYFLSNTRMNRTFPVIEGTISIPTDVSSKEEGKRLFLSRGCIDCHGKNLAGQVFIDDPAMGRFTGTNLTKGLGGLEEKTTDFDLARGIRQGVAFDGRALLFMPSSDFQGMSDEEVGKLIAYIRSVPPVNHQIEPQKVGPLARILFVLGELPLLVSANIINHSVSAPKQVKAALTPEYGRYVAATCSGCHGPEFSGGPIPGAPPDWPHAQNITSTGIGHWTESNFIQAIRTGIRPDGSKIRPPMSWQNLGYMNDLELKAIWLFLNTLPTKTNR